MAKTKNWIHVYQEHHFLFLPILHFYFKLCTVKRFLPPQVEKDVYFTGLCSTFLQVLAIDLLSLKPQIQAVPLRLT